MRIPADISATQEVSECLLNVREVQDGRRDGRIVALAGRSGPVLVGPGTLVKVNTNIGCSRLKDITAEHLKIDELAAAGYGPDTAMDLSIVRASEPLYERCMDRLGVPVGTLPHYLCYKPRRGMDAGLLMEEIHRQAEAGVAWMTLHLSVTRELYELARRLRKTPTTARGGGIVISDMLLNDRAEGILAMRFNEIIEIMARHGTVLSLGTTFRPANTIDALDLAHRNELALQRQFADEARRQGVPVMLEAVGHMKLSQVEDFVSLVRSQLKFEGPIMTLGPIPTDAAVGEDHIANAIGGAMLAYAGGTNVLNCVTREEHTGGVPTSDSMLESLRAARIAAQAVNISIFPALDSPTERGTIEQRSQNYTCVVEGGLFSKSSRTRFQMGCRRCGNECPLLINFIADRTMADGREDTMFSASWGEGVEKS
jgi:phosphomethylpyrimidine synthase